MVRIGLWFADGGALLIQVGFVSLFGCGFGSLFGLLVVHVCFVGSAYFV